MAKILIEKAKGGQTVFLLPVHDKTATAKVNGVTATVASQNEQSVTLSVAAAQDDSVEITFNPVDQYGKGRTERFVPTTGQTIAPTSACGLAVVEPAGTLAALTVTFPANPAEGQQFRVFTSQALTAITWTGGTVVGAPSTLAANGAASFEYSAVTGKWYSLD